MKVFVTLSIDETNCKWLDMRASTGIGKGPSMDRHLLNLEDNSGQTHRMEKKLVLRLTANVRKNVAIFSMNKLTVPAAYIVTISKDSQPW